jgi:hypothetical protein
MRFLFFDVVKSSHSVWSTQHVVCFGPKILCNLQLATICSNKEVRVMISPPEEVFDPWKGMRLIWLGQKGKDC